MEIDTEMKTKAQLGMQLGFLIGLLFTGFLIVISYSLVSNFFYAPPIEKDVVDNWAKEINDIIKNGDNRVTQLLPAETLLNKEGLLLFLPKSTSSKRFDFSIKRNGCVIEGRNGCDILGSIPNQEYTFLPNCDNSNCLCSFNMENGKSYCQTLNGNDLIAEISNSVNGVQIQGLGKSSTSRNKNIIFSPTYVAEITSDEGGTIHREIHSTPFITYDRSTRTITICEEKELC